MTTSKFVEAICAMQREILNTTTRTTGLMWKQMVEFTEILVKHNPCVPDTAKEVMAGALSSYLDFVAEKENISNVVNGASKEITELVMKSMGIYTESNEKTDVGKQVLDLVGPDPKK